MADPQEIDILLVEDNPNDAELTQRALRKNDLGARLTIAKDGAEALEYLLSSRPRPKVIFLDLKLPKIDGIEVLRRLRADDRTRSIPVVVLTSSQEERDIAECYKLGCSRIGRCRRPTTSTSTIRRNHQGDSPGLPMTSRTRRMSFRARPTIRNWFA